jgi:hypothetical protein
MVTSITAKTGRSGACSSRPGISVTAKKADISGKNPATLRGFSFKKQQDR